MAFSVGLNYYWLQKKGTAAPGGYDPFAGLKTPETKQQTDSKITNELF